MKLGEEIEYADGSKERNGPVNLVMNAEEKNAAKDETDESEEDFKFDKERDEQGYVVGERKKGVLRKLHLHKV